MGWIVVGVDGSAEGRLALRWAVEAASSRGASVRVIRAYFDEADIESYQLELDDAVAFVDERLGLGRVEGCLVLGSVAKRVVEAAGDAELVALGTGSGPGRPGSPGAVVTGVAEQSACPVVAVRGGNWSDPILVASDCSARSEEAVAFAFEQAEQMGLRLTVAYCWQPPHQHDDESALADKRALLKQWLVDKVQFHRDNHPTVSVQFRVLTGRPTEVLAALAPEHSLLVLEHHRRRQSDHQFESVSRRLLRKAACSVAVVPGESE